VLASKIDEAVTKLIKNQFRQAQSLQQYAPQNSYSPQINIPQFSPVPPNNNITPSGLNRIPSTPLPKQTTQLKEVQQDNVPQYLDERGRRIINLGFQYKHGLRLNKFSPQNIQNLITQASSTDSVLAASAAEKLKNLAVSCPTNLVTPSGSAVAGRQQILDAISSSNLSNKNEILFDVFHDLKQFNLSKFPDNFLTKHVPGVKQYLDYRKFQKLNKIPQDLYLHQNAGLDAIKNEFPDLYQQLLKVNPSDVPAQLDAVTTKLLSNPNPANPTLVADKVQKLEAAKNTFSTFLKSDDAANLAKQTAEKLINPKEKIVNTWLDVLVQKAPWLGKFAKALGTLFGVLMLAWQFWSLYEEWKQYGPDPLFYCDLVSVLVGLGVFTPAAPVMGALSLLLSVGCPFVLHHNKIEKDKMPPEDYCKTHAKEVSVNDIDKDDLNTLINTVENAESSNKDTHGAVDQMAKSNQFKNLRDLFVLWWKYNNEDPNAIPGLDPKYSDLVTHPSTESKTQKTTPNQTQEDTAKQTKSFTAFNLKKYSMAY